jgi:hypothetical protein
MRAIDQDETVIEGQAEDITVLANEIDADERAILAEFGADEQKATWKIKIYKMGEGNARGWVVDITPQQLPYLEKLRRLAGPGIYHGYAYQGPKLRKVVKWNIVELVEQPQAATDGALGQLVTQMGKTMNEMMAQIAAIKQAPPVQPQATGVNDMMNIAIKIAELMKPAPVPPPPPPPPQKDPMEMLTATLGLARELANGDKEKSTLEVVADIFASPLVQETLKSVASGAQQARPPAGLQPQRLAAPPMPPGPQVPQPAAISGAAPAGSMPFANEIEFLLQGARKDIDPVSYADVCVGLIDEVTMAQLMALPDPISLLIQANPNVEPFRKWFGEFFDALTDVPEDDDIPADATGREPPAVAADLNP